MTMNVWHAVPTCAMSVTMSQVMSADVGVADLPIAMRLAKQ